MPAGVGYGKKKKGRKKAKPVTGAKKITDAVSTARPKAKRGAKTVRYAGGLKNTVVKDTGKSGIGDGRTYKVTEVPIGGYKVKKAPAFNSKTRKVGKRKMKKM